MVAQNREYELITRKSYQTISRGVSAADHAIRSGDRASGGHQIDLSEGD